MKLLTFAGLVLAFALLFVALWAFAPAAPIPRPIGWAVLLALALWASWPILKHLGRRTVAFLTLGFLGLALSSCAGMPLTGNPAADAKTAASNIGAATNPQTFAANLKAFNDAMGQVCAGYGNLDWNPPLPPTGSLHAQCAFGKQPAGTGTAPSTTLGLSPAAIGTPAAPAVPQ